jgi:MSHA pilin protein MshD
MRTAATAVEARRLNRVAGVAGSHGFTLIELIVTMLIISIAALGVTYVLGLGLQHQADPMWQVKAVALAQAYAEEIASRRYDEQTPSGGVPPCSPSTTPCSAAGAFDDGESRAEYDDIDDYDGVLDKPPRDTDGNPLPEYASYQVAVAVAYATPAQASVLGLDSGTDAKIVTITVSNPEGGAMSFSTLRGNF